MFEDEKGYTQVEEYDSYEDIDEKDLHASAEKKKMLQENKKQLNMAQAFDKQKTMKQ